MDIERYRQRLLQQERDLSARFAREGRARELDADLPTGDTADESVADELKDEALTEADADWTTLGQVRDALQRIDDGSYGRCAVDGGPIEEQRLEAVPWTPYCVRHAREREDPAGARGATL